MSILTCDIHSLNALQLSERLVRMYLFGTHTYIYVIFERVIHTTYSIKSNLLNFHAHVYHLMFYLYVKFSMYSSQSQCQTGVLKLGSNIPFSPLYIHSRHFRESGTHHLVSQIKTAQVSCVVHLTYYALLQFGMQSSQS